VEDLLDVSRITAGKLVLDARPIDLAAVAEAAVDAVRTDAEAKQVRLEQVFELGEGRIQGDPARLQQVVWNLLANAVKFSPRGGRRAPARSSARVPAFRACGCSWWTTTRAPASPSRRCSSSPGPACARWSRRRRRSRPWSASRPTCC